MNFPPPTEKQARLIWKALTAVAIVALVALVVVVLWAFGKVIRVLSPVLWPVVVAVVVAFVLNPVVDFFQKKGRTRTQAILTVFGITFLLITAASAIIVPQLVKETRSFVERVPDIIKSVERRLDEMANAPVFRRFMKSDPAAKPAHPPHPPITNAPPRSLIMTNETQAAVSTNTPSLLEGVKESTLESAKSWVTEAVRTIGGWLFGSIASWFGIIVSLVLVPVYAFYILVEKYEIEKNWTDYLPVANSKFKTELVFVLRALKTYLVAFFRGQILVAFCEGILYTIGFLIIQLPYGLVLGASAAVLTIVPFLGAVILTIVSFIVAVVQCGDWQHPALVLVVVVIVQSLEVFWLSPRIMKGRVGLHPAIIIFAVMAGTTLLGGLLGGIVALPLAAMIKVMLSRYVWRRREA